MPKLFRSLLVAIAAFLAGNASAREVVVAEFESDVRAIAAGELEGSSPGFVGEIADEVFLVAAQPMQRFQWDGTVDHFR